MWEIYVTIGSQSRKHAPNSPQNSKWTKLTDLSHINFDDLVKTNKFLQGYFVPIRLIWVKLVYD